MSIIREKVHVCKKTAEKMENLRGELLQKMHHNPRKIVSMFYSACLIKNDHDK